MTPDYKRQWRKEADERAWSLYEDIVGGCWIFRSPLVPPPMPTPPWFPEIEDMSELDVIDPALRPAYTWNRPMVEGDL